MRLARPGTNGAPQRSAADRFYPQPSAFALSPVLT
jgi:hypothetical protein